MFYQFCVAPDICLVGTPMDVHPCVSGPTGVNLFMSCFLLDINVVNFYCASW